MINPLMINKSQNAALPLPEMHCSVHVWFCTPGQNLCSELCVHGEAGRAVCVLCFKLHLNVIVTLYIKEQIKLSFLIRQS